jgi:hypothetical protein
MDTFVGLDVSLNETSVCVPRLFNADNPPGQRLICNSVRPK